MRKHVMQKKWLLMLAVGALVWGFGAPEVRAGFIPLPTTLDVLTTAGNFTTVQNSNEVDTFSAFGYSTSPANTAPSASGVTVTAVAAGNESGLSFRGAFFALAGTVVDYAISYTVSAPAGFVINDAVLSATFNTFDGSTGTGSIAETVTPIGGGPAIALPTLTSPNSGGTAVLLPPSSGYLVQKDILLVGGSGGIGVSFINQEFSSVPVPEPTSIALMGIGMTGFIAFRRFVRRASAA